MNSRISKGKLIAFRVISFFVIASIMFIQCVPNQAYAYDTPVNHTEKSNKTSWNAGGWTDIYAASSIGFMGAEWSSSRQAWCFNYRFAGAGASRYRSSGNDSDYIRVAAMEVEGTSNKSNLAIWTSSDDKYIGSAPASGSKPDYESIANAVIGFAITVINNLGASYVWSTIGLIQALCSTVDSSSDKEDYLWRSWDWSSDISDTGQFFWFLADVEPNETAQISYNYMLIGPGYELLEAGKGYRNLEAPGPKSKSKMKNWNPGMMSKDEKEKYGIIAIPKEKVKERATELMIPSKSVEEFYNSGDEVLYYADKLVEYEVNLPESIDAQIANNEMTKDALIKEINNNVRRSELIIKAYSHCKNNQNDNSIIIEKHNKRKEFLKIVLKKVNATNRNDTKNLRLLWNEL